MALPEDQYTSIAINNRGAGNSQAPDNDSAYSIEAFAADAYALTRSIGWERFNLVGHSMGGATAAQLAVDHPECLETLVLLNPASPDGRPGTPEQIEERTKAFLSARRQRLAKESSSPIPDELRDAASGARNWRALLDLDMARTSEQRLRGSMRSMHHARLGAQLQSLTVPTLMACGDRDDVIPLANMLATWARLPSGSGLQVWHGFGHSPNLDHPRDVASTLCEFMAHHAMHVGLDAQK